MGPALQTLTEEAMSGDETMNPAAALTPVLMAVVFLALFIVGLLLSAGAEDDFTGFAGWAIAGFGLVVGGRYFKRLLP